jgi:hypothetical protein
MLWLAEHFFASNKKVKELRKELSASLSEKIAACRSEKCSVILATL